MLKLFERATELVTARRAWEEKQKVFDSMRREGLRRRNKPFPGAADLHFPEIDMLIRRWKPFWFAQVFNNERLAQFVALDKGLAPQAEAASDFFDFHLNQETNFERAFAYANDFLNLRGRAVLKVTADTRNNNRMVFQAIDPLFILMPDCAGDFGDSDEFVEVVPMTVGAYRRDGRNNQDKELIRKIRGGNDEAIDKLQGDAAREGVTWSSDDNLIIIYLHHVRSGDDWTVNPYSPQAPGEKIREPFKVPYRWKGEVSLPYFSLTMEETIDRWHAPRGLAELLADFESYLTRLWTEKADSLTFASRPRFTAPPGSQINVSNIKFQPLEFVPGGFQQVEMNSHQVEFDREMQAVRGLAEQVSVMPDFGVGDRNRGSDSRTATEISFIQQLSQTGVEMNGRMLRRQITSVYRHCWALLLQYRPKEFTYLAANELKVMPETLLTEQWLIQPDGSPDQWNKGQNYQRAQGLFLALKGHPNVNQGELAKNLIAATDPRLVRPLYQPDNIAEGEEREDEAKEILILSVLGRPVVAKPSENHAVRIQEIMDWVQAQVAKGTPPNAVAIQRVMEHLGVHLRLFSEVDPKAAAQLTQGMQQLAAQGGGAPGGSDGTDGSAVGSMAAPM